MRFIHPGFVYVVLISAIFLYLSFYTMITISLIDIWSKGNETQQ